MASFAYSRTASFCLRTNSLWVQRVLRNRTCIIEEFHQCDLWSSFVVELVTRALMNLQSELPRRRGRNLDSPRDGVRFWTRLRCLGKYGKGRKVLPETWEPWSWPEGPPWEPSRVATGWHPRERLPMYRTEELSRSHIRAELDVIRPGLADVREVDSGRSWSWKAYGVDTSVWSWKAYGVDTSVSRRTDGRAIKGATRTRKRHQ